MVGVMMRIVVLGRIVVFVIVVEAVVVMVVMGVVNIELIDGFVFSYFWYMASFMGRRKEDAREKWKSAKVKV